MQDHCYQQIRNELLSLAESLKVSLGIDLKDTLFHSNKYLDFIDRNNEFGAKLHEVLKEYEVLK